MAMMVYAVSDWDAEHQGFPGENGSGRVRQRLLAFRVSIREELAALDTQPCGSKNFRCPAPIGGHARERCGVFIVPIPGANRAANGRMSRADIVLTAGILRNDRIVRPCRSVLAIRWTNARLKCNVRILTPAAADNQWSRSSIDRHAGRAVQAEPLSSATA